MTLHHADELRALRSPDHTTSMPSHRLTALPGVADGWLPDRPQPILVTAWLVRSNGGALLRTGCLTPYLVEGIMEDVQRAGPDARLILSLPAKVDDPRMSMMTPCFTLVRERGVPLSVIRGRTGG